MGPIVATSLKETNFRQATQTLRVEARIRAAIMPNACVVFSCCNTADPQKSYWVTGHLSTNEIVIEKLTRHQPKRHQVLTL